MLGSLAPNGDQVPANIHVTETEPAQFRHSKARPVEQLENREIPETDGQRIVTDLGRGVIEEGVDVARPEDPG